MSQLVTFIWNGHEYAAETPRIIELPVGFYLFPEDVSIICTGKEFHRATSDDVARQAYPANKVIPRATSTLMRFVVGFDPEQEQEIKYIQSEVSRAAKDFTITVFKDINGLGFTRDNWVHLVVPIKYAMGVCQLWTKWLAMERCSSVTTEAYNSMEYWVETRQIGDENS